MHDDQDVDFRRLSADELYRVHAGAMSVETPEEREARLIRRALMLRAMRRTPDASLLDAFQPHSHDELMPQIGFPRWLVMAAYAVASLALFLAGVSMFNH